MRLASFVVVSLLANACGKTSSKAPNPDAAVVHVQSPPPDGGASIVPRTATSTADTRDLAALRALSEQERAKAKSYADALARGRAATKSKSWPEAIVAFDDALGAKPHDPRALAERGYARLLAGKTFEAESDLREASQLALDPKLRAQIHFNLGLATEKTDHDNARAQFWASNHLSPSAAAKAKIGDKPVCPIDVRHDLGGGELFPSKAESTTHLALLEALAKDRTLPDDQRAKTEDAAKAVMFGRDVPKVPPVVFELGRAGEGRAAYLLVKTSEGKLRAHLLGVDAGGRCPGKLSFAIEEDVRDANNELRFVHVRGRELVEGGYVVMCFPKDDEMHPCGGDDPDTVPRQWGCGGGNATERDILFDARGRSIVVDRLLPFNHEDAGSAAITAKIVEATLKISGLDCNRTLSFDTDAGK